MLAKHEVPRQLLPSTLDTSHRGGCRYNHPEVDRIWGIYRDYIIALQRSYAIYSRMAVPRSASNSGGPSSHTKVGLLKQVVHPYLAVFVTYKLY